MPVRRRTSSTTREEAERLELPPLIIRDSLERYLAEHLPGDDGELELERIGEGHSNITYLVARGERALRAAPPAAAAAAAERARRAARVAAARRDQGHGRRASPRTLLACDDETVIGAPFYVMEYVRGDR